MRIHLLILAAMVAAPTVCTEQKQLLMRLDNRRISERARHLNERMHKRALMRKGVLVIGSAIVAYQAYEVLGYFFGSKSAVAAAATTVTDTVAPKQAWGEWFKAGLHSLASRETWKNVGLGITYCLGNIIL